MEDCKSQWAKIVGGPNSHAAAKTIVQNFLDALFRLARDTNACFVRGSFVVDDSDNLLKPILKEASKGNLEIPESHLGFNPYRGPNAFCDDGVCEVHLPTPVKFACGEEVEEKGNLKWYTFNNTADQTQPQRFVFFKPEGHATYSAKHLMRAVVRYGGLENKKNSGTSPKRREDCARDKKFPCACTETTCSKKFATDANAYKVEDRCVRNVDTYKRLGDEFFIPSEVTRSLVCRVIKGEHPGIEDGSSCQ